MNETYLMVNGKKIDLPKETVEQIKNSFDDKTRGDFFITEFKKHLPSNRQYIEVLYANSFLKVRYPIANDGWTFSVWDACRAFCNEKRRFPMHEDSHDIRYLYIKVEE